MFCGFQLRNGLLHAICCCILGTLIPGCDGATHIPPEGGSSTESGSSAARPKTTDKIEEFKPEANKEVVSSQVVVSNPITAALEAYQPIKQQLAGLHIEQAVGLFQAEEGRYPKDFEEFRVRIVDANKLRLPSLPKGLSYQYDVDNHKLVVVRDDTGAKVE